MGHFYRVFLKTLGFLSAIFFIFIAITLLSLINSRETREKFSYIEGNPSSENKIIFIKLSGPIFNSSTIPVGLEILENLDIIYADKVEEILLNLQNEKFSGLLISLNSPGGTVTGSYRLYNSLVDFQKKTKRPIYIHTEEILASGGFWGAIAAKKIYASYGSFIGSIGVKGPEWFYYDNPVSLSSGLFGTQVTTKNSIKNYQTLAGKSKDLFNSFREPNDFELESLQKIVDGIYFDFINLVSKHRKIETNYLINDIGALIFDSKIAKDNYLIDGVASLKKAKELIVDDLNLKDFKFIEYKYKRNNIFNLFIDSKLKTPVNYKNIEICDKLQNTVNVYAKKINFMNCNNLL